MLTRAIRFLEVDFICFHFIILSSWRFTLPCGTCILFFLFCPVFPRCLLEMHDALQMAMTGHARLLDQYAELQEKHIIVVSKIREIRDGVENVKTVAKKAGLTCDDDRWFDVQAKQIVFMKAELDQYKEEIKGLRSQLRDTADAVQAAGELVVRLKEAEQAAVTAKVYSVEPSQQPRLQSLRE